MQEIDRPSREALDCRSASADLDVDLDRVGVVGQGLDHLLVVLEPVDPGRQQH